MRIAVAAAAFLCMAAPLAAQQHDMNHGKADSKEHAGMEAGKLPAGWHARLDNAKASLTDVKFHKMGDALHVMTGPAAIVWNPTDKATGNFTVSGEFELMKVPAHPEAYGLVLAGENLDRDNQSYLYFLVRHDGKFLIKHRAGADVHGITEWTAAPSIVKPDAKGHSKNVLEFARNSPMTAEGLTGVRINHNLDVHVNDFKVTRK